MSREHLKPVRSKDEAKERGRKGGIASGKARREMKTRRELLLWLLSHTLEAKGVPILSPITGKEQTIDEALLAVQIKEALNGDTRAFNALMDVLGERTTKQEVSGSVTANVEVKERPLEETLADIDRLGVLADIARNPFQ